MASKTILYNANNGGDEPRIVRRDKYRRHGAMLECFRREQKQCHIQQARAYYTFKYSKHSCTRNFTIYLHILFKYTM